MLITLPNLNVVKPKPLICSKTMKPTESGPHFIYVGDYCPLTFA